MEKWLIVGVVAFGGVNLTLLLYLAWSDQKAKREAQKIEKQLGEIKQSVDGILRDVAHLKQEVSPEPTNRRRVRQRREVDSEVESEVAGFYSSYERHNDSDNFFDFSDEEPIMKQRNIEEILSEIDLKEVECQTNPEICDEVMAQLKQLIQDPTLPLDTSKLTSADIGWRIARCHVHIVGHMKISGVQNEHICDTIKEGLAFAEAAIRLDSDSWISHKWYAICCGTLSEMQSTTEKARLGAEYKSHLETAMNLAPNEPTLYHLMGQWYFTLSDLSWVTKKAATTMYGDIFSGTNEQAEEMFLKAENLSPGFWIKNRVFLAKCAIKRGDKNVAKEWLEKALKQEVTTPDDRQGVAEARQIAVQNSWDFSNL